MAAVRKSFIINGVEIEILGIFSQTRILEAGSMVKLSFLLPFTRYEANDCIDALS